MSVQPSDAPGEGNTGEAIQDTGGLPPVGRGASVRPLLVEGGVLFGARGLELVRSEDDGIRWRPVARTRAPLWERLVARFPTAAEIGRIGLHALAPVGGGFVAAARGRIVRVPPGGRKLHEVLRIERGMRPLRLCSSDSGRVFFGEYYSNPGREQVRVFGTEDGERWEVVHVFPAGSVRHIHATVADEYRKGMWVLTGDDDDESGLWFTGDEFATLHRVLGGSQRARAADIIPVRDGVLVPTDTPRRQNVIQHLDIREGRLRPLAKLPGSVFHAVRAGGLFFLATVVEPRSVSRSSDAWIYGSEDGEVWRPVARFRAEHAWLRSTSRTVARVLAYPGVSLVPAGRDATYLIGGARGLRGVDRQVLRWRISDVRSWLRRSSGSGPPPPAGSVP